MNSGHDRQESRSATHGKSVQCLNIASGEGFLLGSGPMFQSVFSILCFFQRAKSFLIDQFDGRVELRRATAVSAHMFPYTVAKITSRVSFRASEQRCPL